MKKLLQKTLKMLALFVLLVNVATPTAFAEMPVAELLQKIAEADAKFDSGYVKGSLKASIENQGQAADVAEVKFESRFNLNDLSVVAAVDLLSPFLGSEAIAAQVYLKDNEMTMLAPGSVEKRTLSADEVSRIKEAIRTYQEQIVKQDYKSLENVEGYYEVTEDDANYLVSLKSGLDGKQMYAKANEEGALDKLKADMLEELNKQNAVDESTRAIYDKIYSPEFFELVFKSITHFVAKYDKESFVTTAMEMELSIVPEDFAKLFEVNLADFEGVPIPELLKLKYNLTIDEHNQPQTIEVPEITVAEPESSSSN